ncbi:hypothetical protein DL96DRAFT_1822532 [Flagelloscypha sp. PMI_526]|nr:hypothetical protein DL96DRAFT_1822532 [Flagelloscypha sp. PMI_526]
MSTNRTPRRSLITRTRLVPRRHNWSQKYCQFPNELLSHIFLVYRDLSLEGKPVPTRRRRVPAIAWLTLAHVCGHWRMVALGCPELWDIIYLNSIEGTKFLLLHSKGAPLHVRYDPTRYTPSERCLWRCIRLVFQCDDRIASLDFLALRFNYWPSQLTGLNSPYALNLLSKLSVSSQDLRDLVLQANQTRSMLPSRVTDLLLHSQHAAVWSETEFTSLRRLIVPECSESMVPLVKNILRRHCNIETLVLQTTDWISSQPTGSTLHPPAEKPIILPNLNCLQIDSCRSGMYHILHPIVASPARFDVTFRGEQEDRCPWTVLLPFLVERAGKLAPIRSFSVPRITPDTTVYFSSSDDHTRNDDSQLCVLSLTFRAYAFRFASEGFWKTCLSFFKPLLTNVKSVRLNLGSYVELPPTSSIPLDRSVGIFPWLTIASTLPKLTSFQVSLSRGSQKVLFLALLPRAAKDKVPFPALRHLTLSGAQFGPQFNGDIHQPCSRVSYASAIGRNKVMPCSVLTMLLAQRAKLGKPIAELVLEECQGITPKFLLTLTPFVEQILYNKGTEKRRLPGQVRVGT